MVRKKLDKREIAAAAGCLLLALVTLTFYIWHQAAVIQLGYKTTQIEEKKGQLEEEIKRLETERETLLAPDRVERIAREELQLVEPSPQQVIYEDGRRIDGPA